MPRRWDPDAIRLLNLGPTAAWRTQAVYHATAELMTADARDTIIICQPLTPYLCLGYHQVFDSVLDRAACEARGLPVVRRRLGGGATYLDANQLFYQCVFHHTRAPVMARDIYARMLAAPVATLRRLGLDARLRDINEVEVNGKRIAGTGGGRIGEAAVVVGNLLFDFDYQVMTEVWRAPSPAFRQLASTALRERLTTLWRETGPVTVEAVQWLLLEEFEKALGRPIQRGTPTQAETRRSRQVAERLGSPEFLDLHSEDRRVNGAVPPMSRLKIAAGVLIRAAELEVDGYRLQASFRVHEGLIAAAHLVSEPARDWGPAAAAVIGAPYADWPAYLPFE